MFFAAAEPASPAGDAVVWKQVEDAQLALGGRGVKTWNVYLSAKQKNLILVLLGRRYLLFDTKKHAVYELDPKDLEAHGKDIESHNPLDNPGKRIPASEWVDRDVGPAQLVRVRLGDYGCTLQLQLPHPVDLRGVY
jgi:hypothetical protein